MKKSLWMSGLLAVVLMGSTLAARADSSSTSKKKNASGPTDMLDKMKEKLNLSDDQYNKLKAMHKSHMDAIKPLMDKMMADMDTLQKKVDAKASDSDLKTVLNSIESDRKNLAAMKEKFSAETTSVLTVTQQAKRLLFQKEEGKGMMGAAMKHMKNKKAAESSTPTSK